MNILPKKSWHVRNKDNIARVRRDEAQAAEEEREVQRRVERAEQEARTAYLRRKSQAAHCGQGLEAGLEGGLEAVEEDQPAVVEKHLNLFPVEEAGEKKGNEEYLKEKRDEKERQERAIGLLVSLGPAPGTEATPWYLKDRGSKEEKEDERDTAKKRQREKEGHGKGKTEEEKTKKDLRLKDSLDPMREMKKALAIKDKHKSKKKDRREKGQKRSGESSIERLRAERLEREVAERRKAQALLDERSGKGKDQRREVEERDRPYNSAYFPELARKRQRRERDQYGL
ncbi:leukocyte receptor cluster member 1 [Conger conger]|uniref:leukocyte receptor cluster member 1 n=1 Tax=Conger conger TaxID=82655 RepID=UPI002A5A7310|nr:leukocyte receptor cluster member 1 [Conger conger]